MFDLTLPANLIVWTVGNTGVCGGFLGSWALTQFLLSRSPRMRQLIWEEQ